MLNRTQTLLSQLTNAERRVGEWLLAHPAQALEQDTRALAGQIGVSQPTLVRFARSLGCTGFDDFRLKWAQEIGQSPGAASAMPVTLATLAASPDLDALTRGLFDFSLQALAQVREQLDRDALAQMIRRLDAARHVLLFGYGNAAVVVDEARRRLLRVPLLVSACSEASLQSLAAAAMAPGDVLLLVSHGGRVPGLLEQVAALRGRGIGVLAITTSGSPLLDAVDQALCLDVPDSGDALTPGTAQLAQLVVFDLLVLGLATAGAARMARMARAARGPKRKAAAARPEAPAKTRGR